MPSAYTAGVNEIVYIDSSQQWTITLPEAPVNDARVGVFNLADDPTPITVIRKSDTYDVRLPGVRSGANFVFSAAENEWLPISITEPGSMYLSLSAVGWAIGSLDAAWVPVQWAAGASLQRHILFSAPSVFQFIVPGVYSLALTMSLTHNETPQGRESEIRIWNVTGSASVGSIRYPTGRNSPGSFASTTLILNITEAMLTNQYRIELGGGDTYSSVVVDTLRLDLISNSVRLVV